jgi:putative two-component system hydrogenase maturation factor HypX/HoxX
LIKSIIFSNEVITVASLNKNAGAGGVFLATACDFVVGARGRILNPHYKTLGLSGSEYHTWTLARRVGEQKAKELLKKCLPISIDEGLKLGMINKVFKPKNYQKKLEKYCKNLLKNNYDNLLEKKEKYLIKNKDFINQHKEDEIKTIYPQFWEKSSSFHKLRYEFVYKICPLNTPKRLKFSSYL